jgi:peroxiredoxin
MRPWLLILVLAVLAAAAFAGPEEEKTAAIRTRLEDALTENGGPALLVFFATDCVSCYEDLFEMRYLVDKNAWPVSIVGIASGIREDLEVFLKKYAWPFPVVWDRKKAVFKRFGVRNAPFKLLLVGGEVFYRDDPYQEHGRRRAEIAAFLSGLFSRFR